jgi:hypothetical protein
MFNLAKWVMSMYMPLVAKMAKDDPFIMITKMDFKLFCDVNLLISLSCLLPMLQTIHILIIFTHKKDVFVCHYVATIKIYLGQLYSHYSNPMTKYANNTFKEF